MPERLSLVFFFLKRMVRALSEIHFPAAFPKLAREARLFPCIRARKNSIFTLETPIF